MLADQLHSVVGVDPHRLAGAAPIPASSGQTTRYRLDRSGDRKLNRTLHQIILTRRRTHPPTIVYASATSPATPTGYSSTSPETT